MKKVLILLTANLIVMFAFAQQKKVNSSLGNFASFSQEKNTILVKTDNGTARITVYTPSVFRLTIVKDAFERDFSYSVVGKPLDTKIFVNETTDNVTIKTDSLQLVFTKKPVRFQFKTLSGKVINEDDPSFGTSWIGEQASTYKKLQNDEKFIGLGEKTGDLNRRGSAYTNWNTDNPAYLTNADPLYGTYPFYMGLHQNMCYGIFLDNTSKTHFNFGASNDRFSSFTAELGEMNYYFIYHNSVAEIIKSYIYLTGRMYMPPYWSLGYQQSRWSYFPDKQLLSIARTFRERNIPCDVMYLDINYMDNYKVFTWHPKDFAKPRQMIDTLKRMGFHLAVIIDPGIKVEKGYKAYEDGLAKENFLKYPDNTPYTAQVWAGWSHFPDFTNEKARKWWGESFQPMINDGVEGYWNDMNEIATWGQKTPDLVEFQNEGEKASYREMKNAYGLLMARSTFEGTKKILGGKRPFVLTRAGYSGVQRYSAVWTGDNFASDEHMMLGYRLINSMGLTGISNVGSDIGGFIGATTPKLFTRWITLGTFTPFFRSHAEFDATAHEPWSFNTNNEEICRKYIQLRYKLLPYIYSAFYESVQTGLPVSRSLAIDYTFDDKIYYGDYQHEFLFGKSLLVCPVESKRDITKVYLPDGEWYYFYDNKKFTGKQELLVECPLDKLPVFVKGGAIVPMQTTIQYTKQKPSDTLMIHVWKGKENNSFVYYEDDGETYEFENNLFYKRTISYNGQSNEISISKKEGVFTSKFKTISIILHGFDETSAKMNNSALKIETVNTYFLATNTNEKSDDWKYNAQKNKAVSFKNSDDEMKIKIGN